MADTINKPSIQIRSGLPSPLPDKSPSPATKLLISHGKPNFTIARSPSVKDNGNPLSPQPNANNNYNAYKSANTTTNNNNNKNINNNNSFINNSNKFVVGTKFNGVFKPSNAAATWATTNGNATINGNGNAAAEQNEAAKVVLRRPRPVEVEPASQDEDENVPEFIRRQRSIQQRLAKDNVLDFENRRSGYFTQVMISPDSPNRTSFVETMASPAIMPALEMPLPSKIEEEPTTTNGHSEAVVLPEPVAEPQPEARSLISNGHSEEPQPVSNGHVNDDVAADEVAKAIEEVNKAVAGEDDDSKPETETKLEAEPINETKPDVEVKVVEEPVVPAAVEAQVEVITPVAAAAVTAAVEPVSPPVQNGDAAVAAATAEHEDITISHTNGHTSDVPSIATPDPSGALGVNYEPKTVVSFSQELGGGENNYPDTVKVIKDAPTSAADAELQELTKLKFDIKNDGQDEVQVTPVLRTE